MLGWGRNAKFTRNIHIQPGSLVLQISSANNTGYPLQEEGLRLGWQRRKRLGPLSEGEMGSDLWKLPALSSGAPSLRGTEPCSQEPKLQWVQSHLQ